MGAYRHNFLPSERALGAASTAPVYVILSDGRGGSPQNSPPQYRIEQLPNGFTTGELADQLSQSASNAGGHLRMLVSCLVCLRHPPWPFLAFSSCASRHLVYCQPAGLLAPLLCRYEEALPTDARGNMLGLSPCA